MATPDILARRTYPETPTKVTLSAAASVLSGTLKIGVVYSVTPTTDVFFKTGTGEALSAVNDDNPLWTHERVEIEGKSDCLRVAFYSASTGTAYLTQMR